MRRRRFLQTAGVTGVVGLAGCTALGSSDEPATDGGAGDGPDESGDGADGENGDGADGEDGGVPEPAPDGQSYEFSGTGTEDTDTFTLEEGLAAFDFEVFGYGYTGLKLLEPGESVGNRLVGEVATGFDGTAAVGVDGGEYYLRGDADEWSVTVRQPRFSEAEYESIPFETTGRDYALLGPFEFERDHEVTATSETEDLVIVDLLSPRGTDAGRVLSASRPEYVGTGTVDQRGPGLLRVNAPRDWTLRVE